MKAYEIFGGWAHICDCCEEDHGGPTLYWEECDFDLCYFCLSKLYFENVAGIEKEGEKVIVKRKVITEELRNKIFTRDGWKCVYCGRKSDLEIDHKVPFSRGGTSTMDNLQTVCVECNAEKRTKVNW